MAEMPHSLSEKSIKTQRYHYYKSWMTLQHENHLRANACFRPHGTFKNSDY